jgi:hypothetical protein
MADSFIGMAIKLTFPDGVIVETDSVREAVQVRTAFAGARTRSARQTAPLVRAESSTPVPPKRDDPIDLSDTATRFLDLLMQNAAGVNTDQAARALHVGLKSLPPVVRGLRRWCSERRLAFASLISSAPKYVNRKPLTLYALTDEGRRTFGPVVQAQRNGAAARRDAVAN